MKRFLFVAALLVPALALALDYGDSTDRYADAPFSREEAAGISVLTNAGVVAGNPDGTFAARRTLNRAEFLKIALLSRGDILITKSDVDDCFPDVRRSDWFSGPVCIGKLRGIVDGYPDGFFHPERPVNYVEALKMLVNVFTYPVPQAAPGEEWYVPYISSARERKVFLPVSIHEGDPLTRGQMARLAAAFLAESKGELALYRQAERGIAIHSSSSSSAPRSSSRSEVGSSTSSTSSLPAPQSSQRSDVGFPATSHQLLIGQTTPILFDGVFTSADEDAVLQSVTLSLAREIKSIRRLFLVDAAGAHIGELFLDTNNNANRTNWIGNFGTGTVILSKGQYTLLGLQADLSPLSNGGGSKEMFELANQSGFSIFTEGKTSKQNRQLFPSSPHTPLSETAQAKLLLARNTLSSSGVLPAGANRQIGSFTFSGVVIPGAVLRLNALTFHLESLGVQVSNWRIGGPTEIEQQPCGVDSGDRTLIICSLIPDGFQDFSSPSPKPLSLYGDVTVSDTAVNPILQVRLLNRGAIGTNGDIWWSDGFGLFRWVEQGFTLADGTRWEVRR